MEKLLIIGKTGNRMTDLSEYMHGFFRVLACTETTQNAGAMLKVVEPDIVLAVLEGIYDVDIRIFGDIGRDYPQLKVITVGTPGEFRNFNSYANCSFYENLLPESTNEEILEAICRNLNIPMPEGAATAGRSGDLKKHILVVDDNAMTLRSIKSMLDDDYKVTIANSGMKALTAIGKERPDLILLDYEMPICDGRQTLEMIRADEEMGDIPVIFLTGVSDREHVEAVLRLKPSGYLLKPPVRKTLIEAIEKELSK